MLRTGVRRGQAAATRPRHAVYRKPLFDVGVGGVAQPATDTEARRSAWDWRARSRWGRRCSQEICKLVPVLDPEIRHSATVCARRDRKPDAKATAVYWQCVCSTKTHEPDHEH